MTEIDISQFFASNDRVQVYRPGTCDVHGACVLYWMQRAQRAQDNHALNAAIALGNALKLPVVVLFVLTEYPAANLRHYTFLLEGLTVTAQHLEQRGTPLMIRTGEPPTEVRRMVKELAAAAVISDESDMRMPRAWRQTLKQQLEVPFACVDADVIIPSRYLPREEWAARTIRPKIQRLLPTYLQPIVDIAPEHPLRTAPLPPGHTDQPLTYLTTLNIDRTVSPSTLLHGGQDEGKRRLEHFIETRLHGYAERRNLPELAGTSELSAYLHFGQLSVQQIAWEIEQYIPAQTGSKLIEVTAGRTTYLEELIVRRELAINFALHNPDYDSLAGCPAWARTTLAKHALDPRAWTYTREELEQARTHDELWNASQRELLLTGRMHGYMRMYWAKKILEWTASPEQAFADAVYLNDKYELDGRDANGYTGIAWAIGGKHDRPWGPERSIFGLVRYMSLGGMQRKMDTRAYIYQWRKQ